MLVQYIGWCWVVGFGLMECRRELREMCRLGWFSVVVLWSLADTVSGCCNGSRVLTAGRESRTMRHREFGSKSRGIISILDMAHLGTN